MSAAAQAIDSNAVAGAAGGETAKKKPLLKKLMLPLIALVVLGGGGAGGWMYWQSQHAKPEDPAVAKAKKAEHLPPPTFLPMDGLVVNLAGRDGERMAQVGITLQVSDAKVAEQLKLQLPAVRNGVLLALSRKSAEELLAPEGKEALAKDILKEARAQLPHGEAPPKGEEHVEPVQKVLFSSFIVQ